MQITLTKTTPIYRSPADMGVFLQWVVTNAPSADLSFKVERAGSPEGPFELVLDKVKGFHFMDSFRHTPTPGVGETRENLNFLSLTREVYYRVTAYAGSDEASVVDEVGNKLPKRQALLLRKIQRDLGLSFKFNGTDLAVVKRKHWGIRCTKCFDKLTKKVTNSKCPVCYGTGIVDGYWNPVRIKARLGAPSSDTQTTPQGKSDITQLRVTCLPYPNIEPDDILVDIALNQRFIVKNQAQTEIKRETAHQILVISELSRDSIEYQIPVNKDHSPVIY